MRKALAIDAAIRRVLASRHHRAGRLTVGYQACDDSTKQVGGFEAETCAANARAYANDKRVVAVIGAYNSDCTQIEIPLANTARGGPLAMVSAASSSAGLTVRTEGEPPGTLEQLYPTGVRNFVRVQPNDNAQAQADVAAARTAEDPQDRDPARPDFGRHTDSASRRASNGLRNAPASSSCAGATWDPAADGYARLAANVVKGVDGVFLAGGMNGNSARLLPALRKASSGRDTGRRARWLHLRAASSSMPSALARRGS